MTNPNINNSIGEKIKFLRQQASLSQKELAEELHISPTAVTNWECGYRTPKRKSLSDLSVFFGVNISYFFFDVYTTKENATITKTISIIKQLNASNQEDVLDYAKHRFEREISMSKPKKNTESNKASFEPNLVTETEFIDFSNIFIKKKSMPVSHNTASAGTGSYLTEDLKNMELMPFNEEDVPDDATFAVPVDGESMYPQFKDGDLAWVKSQPIIEIGEIGLFSIDEKGYIKKRGTDELISTNKDYENIPLCESQEIKCWGKIIGSIPMPSQ